MQVRIELLFGSPGEADRAEMKVLGQHLSEGKGAVEVYAVEDESGRLGVECTMRTEAQCKAVEKIDFALEVYGGNWSDSVIYFPKTEAERALAQRKAERRRAKREASKKRSGELPAEDAERIIEDRG